LCRSHQKREAQQNLPAISRQAGDFFPPLPPIYSPKRQFFSLLKKKIHIFKVVKTAILEIYIYIDLGTSNLPTRSFIIPEPINISLDLSSPAALLWMDFTNYSFEITS
jgi:hypothetical protein